MASNPSLSVAAVLNEKLSTGVDPEDLLATLGEQYEALVATAASTSAAAAQSARQAQAEAARLAQAVVHGNARANEAAKVARDFLHQDGSKDKGGPGAVVGTGSGLRALETLRNNLASALDGLSRARIVSLGMAEMDAVLAAGDPAAAAARILAVRRAAAGLASVPRFSSLPALLQAWHARLDALTGPALANALEAKDAAAAARLVTDIYAGRETAVHAALAAARTRPLLRSWAGLSRFEEDRGFEGRAGAHGDPFVAWLGEFYAEAELWLAGEAGWAVHIGLAALPRALAGVLRAGLANLDPPFAERLRARMAKSERPVELLVAAQNHARRFARALAPLLVAAEPADADPEAAGADPTSAPASTVPAATPAASGPGSSPAAAAASREAERAAVYALALEGIFAPFLEFGEQYGRLEAAALVADIRALRLQPVPGFLDAVRNVTECAPRVVAICARAPVRCLSLTLGHGAAGLIEALEAGLGEAVRLLVAVLRRIRLSLGLSPEQLDAAEAQLRSASASQGGGAGNAAASQDAAPLIFDWSNCHAALQLASVACQFADSVRDLDRSVAGSLASLHRTSTSTFSSTTTTTTTTTTTGVLDGLGIEGGIDTESGNPHQQQQQQQGMDSQHWMERATSMAAGLSITGTPEADLRARRDPARTRALHSLLDMLRDSPSPALPLAVAQADAWRDATRALAYDTMFFVVRDRLQGVPMMGVFTSTPARPTDVDGYEIPTFSLGPLPYVTQIGEHLLTLPQQLEPFGQDEAFAKALPPGANNNTINSNNNDNDQNDHAPSFAFAWLEAITAGTVALFAEKVAQIQAGNGGLSAHGSKQLAADISYLENVFSVLGVSAKFDLKI